MNPYAAVERKVTLYFRFNIDVKKMYFETMS